MSTFIGLNKSSPDASVCVIRGRGMGIRTEILHKDRISRIKRDSRPIDDLLVRISSIAARPGTRLSESSYHHRPAVREANLERIGPYLESLRQRGISEFFSASNPALDFLPHHYCHARAAAAMSPFRRALIVVRDGGGSFPEAFPAGHPELKKFPPPSPPGRYAEACTVYTQDGARLRCVEKIWQAYHPIEAIAPETIADGLGSFYDLAAYFAFGSRHESGKLMGLAPFGRARAVKNPVQFHRDLDWSKAHKGGDWDRSPHRKRYADLAATVQAHFEKTVLAHLRSLARRFPRYRNLILSGGCALNCVTNARALEAKIFDSVYVPAFPGDEGISFGAASHLLHEAGQGTWKPLPATRQTANFGPTSSVPTDLAVRQTFKNYSLTRLKDPATFAAKMIADGNIIGWFQGRSESGARALGYRSILASPSRSGTRDRLNSTVKQREAFRPYGCATRWENAALYFEVPTGIDAPFMSFAPRVRPGFVRALSEVCHRDGTSRIQTVRQAQNPLLYRLLVALEKQTGVGCVLNTSLNRAGEPLVETLADAETLLANTSVDGMIVGNFFVRGRG